MQVLHLIVIVYFILLNCLSFVQSSESEVQLFREKLLEKVESESESVYEYRKSWIGNHTDQVLEHWLKYGDYDFEKASKILQKSLNWRRENQIESILSWKGSKIFERDYPYRITGYTDSGTAILYSAQGIWDLRRGVQKSRSEMKKYMIQMFERTMNEVDPKTGLKPSSFIFIGDLAKYSFLQVSSFAVLSYMREIAAVFENNYPYYVDHSFMINTPGFFSVIFQILKVFNPTTVQQMQLFGTRKSDWETVLKKNIPDEAYPSEL